MMMMMMIVIIIIVQVSRVRSGQQSPCLEPGDTSSRRQGTPPSPHRQCWHHKTSKDAAQCPVRCCNNDGVEFGADITSTFQCCFTSTKTIRLFSDGEPTTATSTFTQLLNSELIFAVDRDVKYQEPVSPLTCTYIGPSVSPLLILSELLDPTQTGMDDHTIWTSPEGPVVKELSYELTGTTLKPQALARH